jgi:pilus assembly protein CpaB
MRQRRLLLILLLALASGAVAGYSILEYLRSRPTPLIASESRSETREVVVAVRDLGLGEVLSDEDVRVVDWPGSSVPEGYAGSVPEVVGRAVIGDIRTNEPILDGKLFDAGLGGGLPPLIPQGMRAISVRVDDVIGVAGYVIPETRVDVILTMQSPNQGEPVSKIILQNIAVRGAGQEIQRDENGEPQTVAVVTVLVDPEQAEKLVLASTQGRIQMALRNPLDLEAAETDGERVSRLFADAPRPTGSTVRTGAAPASSEPTVLEIYRGGVRTLISY